MLQTAYQLLKNDIFYYFYLCILPHDGHQITTHSSKTFFFSYLKVKRLLEKFYNWYLSKACSTKMLSLKGEQSLICRGKKLQCMTLVHSCGLIDPSAWIRRLRIIKVTNVLICNYRFEIWHLACTKTESLCEVLCTHQ